MAWCWRSMACLDCARHRLGRDPPDRLSRRTRDHRRADLGRRGEPAAGDATARSSRSRMAEAYALAVRRRVPQLQPGHAPCARSTGLARFLPPGTDPQLGWNGAGTQRAARRAGGRRFSAQAVTQRDRHAAGTAERRPPDRAWRAHLCRARRHDRFGQPALCCRGRPRSRRRRPASAPDQAAETALQSQLPAFFEAFASGDRTTLARFTWPGAQDHRPGRRGDLRRYRQRVRPGRWRAPPDLGDRHVAAASGAGIAADGTAGVAPAALQMTYQMTVVRQGSSWDVQSIGASTRRPRRGRHDATDTASPHPPLTAALTHHRRFDVGSPVHRCTSPGA